jgi:hypothetical protein
VNLFCTRFRKRFISRLAATMSAVLICSFFPGLWTGNTAEAAQVPGTSLRTVTMQVYAVEDAYAKGGIDAGNNFGSAGVLHVKYSLTTPNSMRESFLKFDLGAVPGRIAHAQLHLYGAATDGTAASGKAVTVSVYQAENDSWSESALTWNTKPAAAQAAGSGITVFNRQPGAWYSDDVTAYMKAKQAKGDAKASLVLLDQRRADCIVAFNSREAAANPPYLSITYELPESGDTAPPAWPEGSVLAASAAEDGSALLLQWPAAEDESGVAFYRIYADGSLQVQLPGDVRSYRLEGVAPGQTLQLQVQAADPGLQWSEPGLSAVAAIPGEPSAPGEEPMPLTAFMSTLGGMSYLPVVKNGQADHWSGLEAMGLPADNSQVYVTGWGGASDLSAKVKFAYDEENFYARFEVKDQVHRGITGSSMWSGDSIQMAFSADGAAYETEYGLGLTESVPEVWRWAAGNAQLGKETVALTAARNEAAQTTVYEAAFPWKALFKEKPADSFQFTYLINDNDGSGRRGWLQWTNGIGLGKDSAQFGTAKLVTDGAGWLSWLSAPASAMVGESVTRTLDLLNFGQAETTLLVRSAELGVERAITVPAGHAVRLAFPVQYGERGEYLAHFEIEDTATGAAETHQSSIAVYESDAQLLARFDLVESLLPGLEALLDQARQQEIPVDYETVNVTVIKDFIQYGKNDVQNGEKERAVYVADQLNLLYREATDNLQAYLDGSKEAKAVLRYRTGSSPIRIDGYSFIADVADSFGDTVRKDRVIFTGYGHFDEVRRDIPKFSGYGTNLIQVEFGPRQAILQSEVWTVWTSSKSGGVQADITVDQSVYRSGTGSLSIVNQSPAASNVFARVWQKVAVEPNTTYQVKAWIKGQDVKNAWFLGGNGWRTRCQAPKGTYDWTEVGCTYTTGSQETSLEFMLLSENTGTVWFDDITITPSGGGENLLLFPGFDDRVIDPDKGYLVSEASIQSNLVQVLEKAAEHNIAVNVLLSPHYFPAWMKAEWPELNSNAIGFIKYNIEAPKARQVIKDYLQAVIPLIKDSPALHSVTLSNEPVFDTRRDAAAHTPAFREYLREQYNGDIAGLNLVYGTGYSGFGEVPMPLDYSATPQFYDWYRFNSKLFTSWHQWMADIVHEIAPGLPVHSKVMNSTLGGLEQGIDFEGMAALSDISGNDSSNYLNTGVDGQTEQYRYYDFLSSLKEAPVFNSEEHIIRDGDSNYVPEQVDHMRTVLWQGAMHRRSASTIWVWARTYSKTSDFRGSVLHRPDVVAEVGKTSLDLNRLVEKVTAFQNDRAKVAILYSLPALAYEASTTYPQAVRKLYRAVSLSGAGVDIITEKQLREGKGNEYSMILVPQQQHLERDSLDNLLQYQESGGTVAIQGADSLHQDEHNQALDETAREAVFDRAIILDKSWSNLQVQEWLRTTPFYQTAVPVVLIDEATGLPVADVEWRSVQKDGQWLLNIANYGSTAKTVSVLVNGRLVTSAQSLIDGVSWSGDTLALPRLSPVLLQWAADEDPGTDPGTHDRD